MSVRDTIELDTVRFTELSVSTSSVKSSSSIKGSRKVGYLGKQGRFSTSWVRRWFVIDADYVPILYSFEDHSESKQRKIYKLDAESTVDVGSIRKHVFRLVTKNIILVARCDSQQSCESWIQTIQSAIDKEQLARLSSKSSTVSACPHLHARALNSICTIPKALKVSYWGFSNDIYAAIKMAKAETGLTDFGFGGERLIISRYDTARRLGMQRSGVEYTTLGQFISLEGLTSRFKERLRLTSYLQRHPEVHRVKVPAPTFVIGLARTGTTFLHELLGLHPNTCEDGFLN